MKSPLGGRLKSSHLSSAFIRWCASTTARPDSDPFQHGGHALTAADTQGCQAQFVVSAQHFSHEGNKNPGPRAADGMADGDPASEHIGLFRIALEFPHAGNGLGGKGFIEFNGAELIHGQPRFFQDLSQQQSNP